MLSPGRVAPINQSDILKFLGIMLDHGLFWNIIIYLIHTHNGIQDI